MSIVMFDISSCESAVKMFSGNELVGSSRPGTSILRSLRAGTSILRARVGMREDSSGTFSSSGSVKYWNITSYTKSQIIGNFFKKNASKVFVGTIQKRIW